MNRPTSLAEVTETRAAEITETNEATGVRRTVQPAAIRGAPSRSGEGPEAAPPVPQSLEETGLSSASLSDLLLRTLNQQGARTGAQLEEFIRLPFHILDDELLNLQQRRFLEVRSTQGVGRRGYVFDLTGEGRTRVREILPSSRYVGPAPVPLGQYWAVVDRQKVQDVRVTRAMVREGFRHMVLPPELMDSLGPAVNSGKSLFLYGFAGNGKTTIAEAIANMMGGAIYVPFSIEVEGQIISIFDPLHHRPVFEGDEPAGGNGWLRADKGHDPRFLRVQRPVVMVGGELTLDQLELQFDAQSGVFRAPPQVKANGGVFIIDDFGRQRVRPRDLLNRWMVPLEKHVDFLTLPMGPKLPVPFECLLIFSTNLDPSELVEEAFLRRIRYKVLIGDPNREQFEEIFERCCAARGVEYSKRAVDYLFDTYYDHGISPRACHPRDIVNQVCDVAQYLEVEPSLSMQMLKLACGAYFLDTTTPQPGHEGSEAHVD